MQRAGRNDSCPCGSGKKYKRCCLGKEAAREEFAQELRANALPLLQELGRHAASRAGSSPEAVAQKHFAFWHPPFDRIKMARLLDHLIFDERAEKYGQSAIAEFLAQRGSIVTPQWKALLEAWQDAGLQLFALEGWSGGFARVREVLTQERRVIEVMPIERAEGSIAAGAPVALRPLPVGTLYLYPGWPITFGSKGVEEVTAAMRARHHDYVRRERIASMEDFLRRDATAFDAEAAAESAPSPIIVPGRA